MLFVKWVVCVEEVFFHTCVCDTEATLIARVFEH